MALDVGCSEMWAEVESRGMEFVDRAVGVLPHSGGAQLFPFEADHIREWILQGSINDCP